MKVDLRKAFDTVNWSFLLKLMTGLNFPQHFVTLIKECVTTASYSILLNGSLHGHFKGKRGLRQGDPLSPLLFVISMEYLSRKLRTLWADREYNPHPKCGAVRINHLIFADDLILFSRGDPISVRKLLGCFLIFSKSLGLTANLEKSQLYMAGVGLEEAQEIRDIAQFDDGQFPFRYLGIPIASTGLKVAQYSPLLEKIADCIKNWSSSTLSYAGRFQLLSTVVQGILCFWMHTVSLPASIVNKIIGFSRNFLWGGSKKPLVAWTSICTPKEEGGLGFLNWKSWNKSLLSRIIWNVHAGKETLWIRWVQHYYLKGRNLWQFSPLRDASPLMKRICGIRDEIITEAGTLEAAQSIVEDWGINQTFVAAKAYQFFRPKAPLVFWAKTVWKDYLMPRHRFILWLAAGGKLLTKDRLPFIEQDPACPLCGGATETAEHLFFSCRVTNSIWSHILLWLGDNRRHNSLKATLRWLKHNARGTGFQAKAKHIALASTVYQLWRARNSKLFEGKDFSYEAILVTIKRHVYQAIFHLYPHLNVIA